MIYYFSGTGNSRRVAARLAEKLHDALTAIHFQTPFLPPQAAGEAVGLVFPVYAWGMPAVVEHFLREMPIWNGEEGPYVYAVLTCGDDIGRTDCLLRRRLHRKGLALNAVFSLRMRNTYVCLPGFDTDKMEVEREKNVRARQDLAALIPRIARQERSTRNDVHPGALPRLKSYVLRPLFNRFLTSPRRFRVDEELCNRCGKCVRHCPLHNLTLQPPHTPIWGDSCTHCLACYHVCPRHAVSYGLFTRGKGQVIIT